jgi:hypothetical protein
MPQTQKTGHTVVRNRNLLLRTEDMPSVRRWTPDVRQRFIFWWLMERYLDKLAVKNGTFIGREKVEEPNRVWRT